MTQQDVRRVDAELYLPAVPQYAASTGNDSHAASAVGPRCRAVSPLGTHITHFFSTGDELREVLVPYFKAGLENNERCLWVTGDAFDAQQARSAMRSAAGEKLQPHAIVDGLVQAEQDAFKAAYSGLRTNGNCSWVERTQWRDFLAYEDLVQQTVRGRRMICLCSYSTTQSEGSDLIAVVGHHDFALSPWRRSKFSAT